MNRSRTALSILGISLLGAFAGGARAESAATPERPARPDRPAAESFLLDCSGCHRSDGRGIPKFAPDLRAIGGLLDSEAGRRYLGRVPGVAQAPLDDAALAALLNWVLVEIADRRPEPPYSAQEIGALRAAPLRDPVAARRALAIR